MIEAIEHKKSKNRYPSNPPLIESNLRRLRLERNMKASDFVRCLEEYGVHISASSYCHVEHGRVYHSIALLEAASKVFDCDFNEFFKEL